MNGSGRCNERAEFLQDGSGQPKNVAAGPRWAHTSAEALENWNAQVVLKLADYSAKARLLRSQQLGGSTKATAIGGSDRRSQVFQFERSGGLE